MYSHPQFAQSAEEVQQLRQQAGRWLRARREAKGFSQRELAKLLGLEYYTFISQIEAGRGRVPPAQYGAFAEALGVPLRDFVKTLMRFYDPVTYHALFDAEPGEAAVETPVSNDNGKPQSTGTVAELEARLARLEAMLREK